MDSETKLEYFYYPKLRCDKKMLRDKPLKEKGIVATAKEMQNLAAEMRDENEDSFKEFVRLLREEYKAVVKIFKPTKVKTGTSQKEFEELVFWTEEMQKTFQAWPDIIFVDITYELLRNGLLTLLICVQDGNCRSHMVSCGLIPNEEAFREI